MPSFFLVDKVSSYGLVSDLPWLLCVFSELLLSFFLPLKMLDPKSADNLWTEPSVALLSGSISSSSFSGSSPNLGETLGDDLSTMIIDFGSSFTSSKVKTALFSTTLSVEV